MKYFATIVICWGVIIQSLAQRSETYLEKGWKFHKGDLANAYEIVFNDDDWQEVTVPHDWAIYGPFDRNIDIQKIAIKQNLETVPTVKTARTGGLPFLGVGWYRTKFNCNRDKQVTLIFDGAMSEAKVYINGKEVCFWPYGYNSFYCDISKYITSNGNDNILAVRLENYPQSSRWYTGAGLYRNVHLVQTERIHIPVWGTQITTPFINDEYASVCLKTKIENSYGEKIKLLTDIVSPEGKVITSKLEFKVIKDNNTITQNFIVYNPLLWSPESPSIYEAISRVYKGDTLMDTYTTHFGIRDIKFIPEKGFYLNGKYRKIYGVCNHHDLGPLGATVNVSALRYQLELLKDMGCNAIRTSHNMPAPELVRLCDEMGFMMIIESFDEWDMPKCKNGYNRYFNDWAEKDMVNMIHQYRNSPSVIMWSIGNEVPNQYVKGGYKVASFLKEICHREDPTRPVTCGLCILPDVLDNGFAEVLDVPGFNYHHKDYDEIYRKLPQKIALATESAATVSSRGIYKFPVKEKIDARYIDKQSSSYDIERCKWSNIPDYDLAVTEDNPWVIGQFVWSGFDYLGEAIPYDIDSWPSHSSLFGIIDLASIPKDRYYLYRSVWNINKETLHILPHWTWRGKEGENIPIYVYTNYDSAELFVNGKSYGIRKKSHDDILKRYRLIWDDVIYEPGEVKVIAYDNEGNPALEKSVFTAGKPHHIELIPNKMIMKSDGKDLVYVNLRIVDKDGNLCPMDSSLVKFSVKGNGFYKAAANGNSTCLDLFHLPQMHAFNGMLTVILQSSTDRGSVKLKAEAKGLIKGEVNIKVD